MGRLVGSLVGCTMLFTGLSAAAEDAARSSPDIRVQNIEVRLSQAGPVVLLKVRNKAIPVFVDALVAESIQGALTGQKPPRPLPHDLMQTLLEALDARVSQVVITFKGGIYYGALSVVAGKTTKIFDSRSSDAIALAIRFKALILVSEDLLDSVGVDLTEPGMKEL
jgi:bifunctional DNase/RNase